MNREELKNWLNSLIGSELVAFLQYEFASHNVEGTDYDSCSSEFKQHADEERSHMNTLIECAIERDLSVNQDLVSIIQNANPEYEMMSEISSDYLIRFHITAEEGAIKTYKEFYNLIKDDDITLANTIKNILKDEIEHRKDLKKIFSSINGTDSSITDESLYANFSKLTKRLRNVK